jgi:tRNA(Ile)-lysidine synthase
MNSPSSEILQQIAAALPALPADQRMLVACSGGADSMFLAHALQKLEISLALAHVNYRLRGADAEADQALVSDVAQRYQVPCHVLRPSPPPAGQSVQEYAREQRYAFFEELMDQHGYAFCATAHHRDDLVETRLLSLLRSRKPRLWHGIPPRRDRYLRPLLEISKAEILATLEQWQLPYRHDVSNDEAYYLRNRVRHQVLPALRAIHPKAETQLLRRGAWYDLQYQWLRQQLAPYLPAPESRRLDWQRFLEQQGREFLPLLVAEVLESWGLNGAERDDALRLIDSDPGAYRDLAYGRLQRVRQGLCLLPLPATVAGVEVLSFTGQRQVQVGARALDLQCPAARPEHFDDPSVLYVDAERLQFPLVLRGWQEGDRMQPLGMRGHKKLSDIFIDAKFSALARQQAVVIVDQEGVVALSDFRVAERVKLRPETQQILRVAVGRCQDRPS